MGMYNSPIETLIADIQHQIAKQQEDEVYKAVVSVGINVDKKELIRALQYDRQQYDIGYADGKRDAINELVRCKDCKYAYINSLSAALGMAVCKKLSNEAETAIRQQDDFCSYGERREGE